MTTWEWAGLVLLVGASLFCAVVVPLLVGDTGLADIDEEGRG